MQSTFGKTIEARVIPSLTKAMARCVEDWKAQIDSSFNAIVQQHSQLQPTSNEDTVQAKKVHVCMLLYPTVL